MANLSSRTRKQQVLEYLAQNGNHWVDGTEIATPQVGGSEGLKRLRELRAEGYPILTRRHPNPNKDVYQYRLTVTGTSSVTNHSERFEQQVMDFDAPPRQDPDDLLKAWDEDETRTSR